MSGATSSFELTNELCNISIEKWKELRSLAVFDLFNYDAEGQAVYFRPDALRLSKDAAGDAVVARTVDIKSKTNPIPLLFRQVLGNEVPSFHVYQHWWPDLCDEAHPMTNDTYPTSPPAVQGRIRVQCAQWAVPREEGNGIVVTSRCTVTVNMPTLAQTMAVLLLRRAERSVTRLEANIENFFNYCATPAARDKLELGTWVDVAALLASGDAEARFAQIEGFEVKLHEAPTDAEPAAAPVTAEVSATPSGLDCAEDAEPARHHIGEGATEEAAPVASAEPLVAVDASPTAPAAAAATRTGAMPITSLSSAGSCATSLTPSKTQGSGDGSSTATSSTATSIASSSPVEMLLASAPPASASAPDSDDAPSGYARASPIPEEQDEARKQRAEPPGLRRTNSLTSPLKSLSKRLVGWPRLARSSRADPRAPASTAAAEPSPIAGAPPDATLMSVYKSTRASMSGSRKQRQRVVSVVAPAAGSAQRVAGGANAATAMVGSSGNGGKGGLGSDGGRGGRGSRLSPTNLVRKASFKLSVRTSLDAASTASSHHASTATHEPTAASSTPLPLNTMSPKEALAIAGYFAVSPREAAAAAAADAARADQASSGGSVRSPKKPSAAAASGTAEVVVGGDFGSGAADGEETDEEGEYMLVDPMSLDRIALHDMIVKMREFADGMPAAMDVVNDALQEIGSFFPELWEELAKGTGKVFEPVGAALDNTGKAFQEFGDNTGKAFQELGDNTGKAFQELGDNTGKAFQELGDNTGKAIQELGDNMGEFIETVGAAVFPPAALEGSADGGEESPPKARNMTDEEWENEISIWL